MPVAAPNSGVQSDDPTVIRVLAVTTDDIVTALEANERRDAGAVLRVTPPFAGRMRARIHIAGTERPYDEPEPLHVQPERFVSRVPPFPTPDDTEDELRSDPDVGYTPERHRSRHERAVERWRSSVRDVLVERVTIDVPAGEHEIRLAPMG